MAKGTYEFCASKDAKLYVGDEVYHGGDHVEMDEELAASIGRMSLVGDAPAEEAGGTPSGDDSSSGAAASGTTTSQTVTAPSWPQSSADQT